LNAGLKCAAHGSLKMQHPKNRHLGTIAQLCRLRSLYLFGAPLQISTGFAFLFSIHPERERDREAHLNYYDSAHRGRQLPHRKTKLNQIQQNTNINLN